MTTALDRRPTGVASSALATPAGPVRAACAWTLAAFSATVATAAVVLHLVVGASAATQWWYGNVGLTATLVVPGLLLAHRRPGNPIGWLILVGCLAEAICGAGREYLVYGAAGHAAPGWLWVGWGADSLYLVGVAMLPTVLALFPDGRPWGRLGRVVAWLPFVALTIGMPGYLFSGSRIEVAGRSLADPGAGLLPGSVTDLSQAVGPPLMLLSMCGAIFMLVARYRHARGEVRQQVKWVMWAGSLTLLEVATEFIPGNVVAPITSVVADVVLVGALTIAILRHRLLDIDLVINRTLLFGVLSALVVGGYVAIVLVADALLGATNRLGPGLLATAVVAVAFAPIRSVVQQRVDRLVYGARREPYRLLTRLGGRWRTIAAAPSSRWSWRRWPTPSGCRTPPFSTPKARCWWPPAGAARTSIATRSATRALPSECSRSVRGSAPVR